MEILPSGVLSRQYSRDAATSTVSIQGSGNHYHACASDDYEDFGFDPSILPPPDPWIDSITDDPMDVNVSSSAILEVCIKLVISSSVSYKCTTHPRTIIHSDEPVFSQVTKTFGSNIYWEFRFLKRANQILIKVFPRLHTSLLLTETSWSSSSLVQLKKVEIYTRTEFNRSSPHF